MEGEQQRGAGPDTTGINEQHEQLRLFTEQQRGDLVSIEATSQSVTIGGLHRLHRLGHRPDRLHNSGHYGARGDRLEGLCRRTNETDQWTPRPMSQPEGVSDGHS